MESAVISITVLLMRASPFSLSTTFPFTKDCEKVAAAAKKKMNVRKVLLEMNILVSVFVLLLYDSFEYKRFNRNVKKYKKRELQN